MAQTYSTVGGIPQLPADDLEQTLTYNGSGQVLTRTVVYKDVTYVQTLTYTGNDCTNISAWIAQ